MRKGRSSRRSKSSRPPRAAESTRAPKNAEAVVGSPRVVIGIACPSEPPAPAPPAPAIEPRRDAASVELDVTETRGSGSGEAMREGDANEVPAASAAGAVDDGGSIPPVVDMVVEEFFSEGDVGKHLAGERDLDDPMARKGAPHVVERRNRFVRYVTWAVGAAAVVCVAAALRAWGAPHGAALEAAGAANAVVALGDRPPPPPETALAAVGAPGGTTDTAAAAPTAEAPLPSAIATAAPTEGTAKTAPEAPMDAAAEKVAARRALEGGKVRAAIEAGERSVALDPTDGEAWLLLGAAYQEKGKLAEARRCYAACVKQGKRGPLGECAAMLQ